MAKSAAHWPAWRTHISGERKIFNSADEVPADWYDSPENAAAASLANEKPPEDGKDAWGGYTKEALTQFLRSKEVKVHANASARKLFEQAEAEFGLTRKGDSVEEAGPAETETKADGE